MVLLGEWIAKGLNITNTFFRLFFRISHCLINLLADLDLFGKKPRVSIYQRDHSELISDISGYAEDSG